MVSAVVKASFPHRRQFTMANTMGKPWLGPAGSPGKSNGKNRGKFNIAMVKTLVKPLVKARYWHPETGSWKVKNRLKQIWYLERSHCI